MADAEAGGDIGPGVARPRLARQCYRARRVCAVSASRADVECAVLVGGCPRSVWPGAPGQGLPKAGGRCWRQARAVRRSLPGCTGGAW
jgi:hypothetical protein